MKFIGNLIIEGLVVFLLPSLSLAVLTSVSSFNVLQIDESLAITSLFDLENARSITNDKLTGKFYSITGTLGNQELVEVCKFHTYPIAKVNPAEIFLGCLSSGPHGAYAIDLISRYLGRLNISTGKWKPLALLPSPYSALVIAQDSLGVIHYINGNGGYYINRGFDTTMEHVPDVRFPKGSKGICGDFDGDDIVTGVHEKEGGINTYSLSNKMVSRNTWASNTVLLDVTSGALPSCSSESPSIFPSRLPSRNPSTKPSMFPSLSPSDDPSNSPSKIPSRKPSIVPTNYPSKKPSIVPSALPSRFLSKAPSTNPSMSPTKIPSKMPSSQPTILSSKSPSSYPTFLPSKLPSSYPTILPSKSPSSYPTIFPSNSPSNVPSTVPFYDFPSIQPSYTSPYPSSDKNYIITKQPNKVNTKCKDEKKKWKCKAIKNKMKNKNKNKRKNKRKNKNKKKIKNKKNKKYSLLEYFNSTNYFDFSLNNTESNTNLNYTTIQFNPYKSTSKGNIFIKDSNGFDFLQNVTND